MVDPIATPREVAPPTGATQRRSAAQPNRAHMVRLHCTWHARNGGGTPCSSQCDAQSLAGSRPATACTANQPPQPAALAVPMAAIPPAAPAALPRRPPPPNIAPLRREQREARYSELGSTQGSCTARRTRRGVYSREGYPLVGTSVGRDITPAGVPTTAEALVQRAGVN